MGKPIGPTPNHHQEHHLNQLALLKNSGARAEPLNWWNEIQPTGSLTPFAVPATRILDNGWCSVVRVEVADRPHTARFCRDRHTVMIYDSGSYVQGERRVDGKRFSSSGPLDDGVDVIPAHTEFVGLADQGSKVVGCTLISIDERAAMGSTDRFGGESIRDVHPAIGLKGALLLPLANQFRRISRGDFNYTDALYIESATVLLFREIWQALQHGEGHPSQERTGGLSGRAQKMVREYLCENLGEKIDLNTLADMINLSRFHFTRAFKKSFGLPPYQYLLNLRIQRAAELLRNTSSPITGIALEVGFSSSGEFARTFRRAMACSPREFRSGAQ
jgi:AraC family transcriptional regulator